MSRGKREKNYLTITGAVTNLGEEKTFSRKGLPDFKKRVLTLETLDGQVLYPEVRNNKLKLIEKEGIEIDSFVTIEFSFEGSEKNDKRYNNIYVNNITLL